MHFHWEKLDSFALPKIPTGGLQLPLELAIQEKSNLKASVSYEIIRKLGYEKELSQLNEEHQLKLKHDNMFQVAIKERQKELPDKKDTPLTGGSKSKRGSKKGSRKGSKKGSKSKKSKRGSRLKK